VPIDENTTSSPAPQRRPSLGILARSSWFGPAVLAFIFIAIMALLLWVLDSGSKVTDETQLQTSANAARESIRRRLTATREYLQVLSEDYDRQSLDEGWMRKRLTQYVEDHHELVGVVQVGPTGEIMWSSGTMDMAGQRHLTSSAQEVLARAWQTQVVTYSEPYQETQGELAMAMVVPLRQQGRAVGALACVYSWDRLMRLTIHRDVLDSNQVSLLDGQGNRLLSLTSGLSLDNRLEQILPLGQQYQNVFLRLVPYGSGFWNVGIILLLLTSTGLVIGMAWGMWSLKRQVAQREQAELELRQARDELEHRVRKRTADLETANAQLQQEMAHRHQAEMRARQHQEHLGHVGRVSTMVEMAAGMAHELNQPLGSICGYTEGCMRMIESGKTDFAELRLALGEVSDQARRAGEIIHRLRRLVSEGGEPERVRGDLKRLVSQVVDLLLPQMRQAKVHLSLELADDLPGVLVDPIQVQQVLLNLMKNAVEAMQANGPTEHRLLVVQARPSAEIKSGLSPDEDGAMVELCVADTGPGCDSALFDKIFDAFFSTKKGGMGMGLSISRTIIEAHGGKLWVGPNNPRGLAVHFTLEACEHRPERPSHKTRHDMAG